MQGHSLSDSSLIIQCPRKFALGKVSLSVMLNKKIVNNSHLCYLLTMGSQHKDEFKSEFGEWNYAIRGATLDGRILRLAVAIKADGFLVITVIDITK